MELFQRQPGVKLYSQWIGTNFIVAYAYDHGTVELVEFGIPFAKITTTGDTDPAVKSIGQYIKTHKGSFHDLTSAEWHEIAHNGAPTKRPAITLTQKAMF